MTSVDWLKEHNVETRVQDLILYSNDGTHQASVHWTQWGPIVADQNLHKKLDDLSIEIEATITGNRESKLARPVRLKLAPIAVRDWRSSLEDFESEIYPPSTGGWYEKFLHGDIGSWAITQREEGSDRVWLTNIDEEGSVVFCNPLRDYEVFKVTTERRGWTLSKHSGLDHTLRKGWEFKDQMFQAAPPTWEQLFTLTKNYDIPEIEIGEDMYSTVSQMVPKDWPETWRESYSLGLASVLSSELWDIDPMDLYNNLRWFTTANIMIDYFISEEMKGVKNHEIARIINEPRVDQSSLMFEDNLHPWYFPRIEMNHAKKSPEQAGYLVKHARTLTESQQFSAHLPVTRKMAKRSRTLWQERHTLIARDFGVSARFSPERLGLKSLIYMGGAYRWPHRHTSWTAVLQHGERSLQIQEMLLPPEAAERVSRVLKRTLTTELYTRRENYPYDIENQTWTYDIGDIIDYMDRRVSLKRLRGVFPLSSSDDIWKPDRLDANVLDTLTQVFYTHLEPPALYDYFDTTSKEFEARARRLIDAGVIRLTYHILGLREYTSRCFILQGDMGKVRSLAYGFLTTAPTCSVYMFEDSAILLSSMHSDKMAELMKILPERSFDSGVNAEIYSISSFDMYRWNHLTRMLRDDGTWDDDIEGLLCQGSGLREVSE